MREADIWVGLITRDYDGEILMSNKHDKDYDAPKGVSRRSFMARGVAVGAVASAAGLGLHSRSAAARTSGPVPELAHGFRAA